MWLTKSDWTALAEIKILNQTRDSKANKLSGEFRVEHRYLANEHISMTNTFRRMYSYPGEFDPRFYLLESKEIYDKAAAVGYLVRDDLIEGGFIHASPANQLTRVANKYYSEVDQLVCAIVQKDRVLAPIKYEPATGGKYPHIYGPLNMDAISEVVEIHRNKDGLFEIDIHELANC